VRWRPALAAWALGAALAPSGPEAAREIDCAALLTHVKTITSLLERASLLESAAASCPRDPAVQYERAFALERLRRYPEALSAYRATTALDPRHAKAHVGVADTLMLLGDPAGAVAAYERGLALDAGNERARRALELARIKARAQGGGDISSQEFVAVMTQSEARSGPAESAEGPLVRLQIQFPSSSAALDRAAQARLAVVGEALRSPALSGARVEISGHTDDAGPLEINLRLSRSRAEAVRDWLVQHQGVPASRLSVAWYGHTRPVVPNTTPANRRLNRRVEFRLVK
jgi:outer membrane protein OmpA-like peptidoglycan-associated protein